MKKRFAVLTAVVTVMLLIFCGCGGEKAGTELTVSEVTHSIFYAPQYAAIELGYFRDEGLEIELVNGGGADTVMTSVISGDAEIGFAGPEAAVYVYNEGREDHAVVFAQMTKRDGSFILGREREEDFSFSDMLGTHVLGGRAGGMPYMTLEYVLGQHGVTPGNTNLDTSIDFNAMAGTFASGTGDYVALFEPTASAMELEGSGYVLASVGEASGEIPYTAYFANKSFIAENPDVIRRFAKAVYRGLEYVRSAPAEEIAEVIAPQFADTDPALLTMVVERYQSIDAWNETPIMTEDSFNRLQDVMTAAGELETRAPYEKIVDNTFAEDVVG